MTQKNQAEFLKYPCPSKPISFYIFPKWTFVHWRISKLILDFHLESRDISEFGSWLFLHLTVSLTHSLSVKKQQKNQHVSRYLVKKSFADFDGSKLENMVP